MGTKVNIQTMRPTERELMRHFEENPLAQHTVIINRLLCGVTGCTQPTAFWVLDHYDPGGRIVGYALCTKHYLKIPQN